MRKVFIEVKTRLIVNADEGVEIYEVINEMDYNFVSNTDKADIIDTEITGYEIIDSK